MTGNKNTNGAQLIVTTQDVSLLSLNRFRRDQICFVEKDNKNGVTDLYSLDEFAPRKNADIRRGYLQGRYGAIPAIGDGMVRRIRFTLRKRRKLPSNQRSAMLSLAIWCIVCLTQILTRSNSVKSMKRFVRQGAAMWKSFSQIPAWRYGLSFILDIQVNSFNQMKKY